MSGTVVRNIHRADAGVIATLPWYWPNSKRSVCVRNCFVTG